MQFFSNLPTFSSNSTELNGSWWGKMLCAKWFKYQECVCEKMNGSMLWRVLYLSYHQSCLKPHSCSCSPHKSCCLFGISVLVTFSCHWFRSYFRIHVFFGNVLENLIMCKLCHLFAETVIHTSSNARRGWGGGGGFTPWPQKYFWLPWL